MRKVIAMIAACAALVVVGQSTPVRADSCKGDLYCDGLPKPCENDGMIYPCSAGDATVDGTLLP